MRKLCGDHEPGAPGKHEVNEQRRCATELIVPAYPAHGFDGDELQDRAPAKYATPLRVIRAPRPELCQTIPNTFAIER